MMSEPKEEWEIGYTREQPDPPIQQPAVVDFSDPVTLVGQHLDGRFLIERNLTDGGADAGGIGIVFLARDMKPENIMLTPQDVGFDLVRVIDFGIARVEESKLAPVTIVTSTKGSIFYIAPEQLAGNIAQTPAVDIYSFAIVVYEMLTGKRPFEPNSAVNMFTLQ